LLSAPILWAGCAFVFHPIKETFYRHSNPIEGWKFVGDITYSVDEMHAYVHQRGYSKAITDDVEDLCNNLPTEGSGLGKRRYCYWITHIRLFEDGTGHHAVAIEIPHHETWWVWVLIYDKNDKRTKTIRYIEGYYMS
jgi:hypothetical protein